MINFRRILGHIMMCSALIGLVACGDTNEEGNTSDENSAPEDVGDLADIAQNEPDEGISQRDAEPMMDTADLAEEVEEDVPAADTWENFARSFYDQYCVECHEVGNTRRDYTTFEDVERDAVRSRCGIAPTLVDGCSGSPAPGQFPVGRGPTPTKEERLRLVAWIEAGLPRDE